MRHTSRDMNRRAVARAYRRATRNGSPDAGWLTDVYGASGKGYRP
jgi:hypothetical protein